MSALTDMAASAAAAAAVAVIERAVASPKDRPAAYTAALAELDRRRFDAIGDAKHAARMAKKKASKK